MEFPARAAVKDGASHLRVGTAWHSYIFRPSFTAGMGLLMVTENGWEIH